jgi:hypothetical protein
VVDDDIMGGQGGGGWGRSCGTGSQPLLGCQCARRATDAETERKSPVWMRVVDTWSKVVRSVIVPSAPNSRRRGVRRPAPVLAFTRPSKVAASTSPATKQCHHHQRLRVGSVAGLRPAMQSIPLICTRATPSRGHDKAHIQFGGRGHPGPRPEQTPQPHLELWQSPPVEWTASARCLGSGYGDRGRQPEGTQTPPCARW